MGNIEEQVKRYRRERRLPQQLADQIRAKYDRHLNSYGQHLDPIALGLISNPGLYDQVNELPSLQLFFKSHIEIALAQANCGAMISCGEQWLEMARFPNRLLIRNPFTEQAESWARPSSVSRNYTVHYRDGGRNDKSRFLGNYSFIKPIELAALNNGVGVLRGSQTLRLYAQFEQQIGRCPQGRPLTYICLEIRREHRPPLELADGSIRKTGRYVAIHGYPIDIGGLELDLAATLIRRADLPLLS